MPAASPSVPVRARWWVGLLGFLVVLAGCSRGNGGGGGGGGDPGAEGARVNGRLVGPLGQGLAGVHVHVEGENGMTTLDDGVFSLPIDPGSVRLLAEVGAGAPPAVLLDVFVATVPGEVRDLGDIAVDAQQDTDGDGIADVDEMTGWTILLNLSARRTLTSRAVDADPSLADTDGDGLTDGEENAALTDPRKRDSDGDLLDDADEMFRYKSNPVDVDSDEDAAGIDGAQLANPSLYDGQEVARLGTSPTLEDTDGDGLTDYEEVTGSGLDPRIADIPRVEIVPTGSAEVVLNIERTGSTTTESIRFGLDATTLTDSTQDVEHTIRSHELNVGLELSSSPSLSIGYHGGWTNERTLTTDTESVEENRREFTDRVESQLDVTVKDGALSVPMEVRNTSNRTIQITDLSVVAFRVVPGSLRDRIVVGALEPATVGGGAFPAVVLPPGGTFAFVAANDHLPVTTVEELIHNPGALAFEIGNYTMTQVDDLGRPFRDFGATGERVLERCALVVVDFGDGEVRRAFVATSVEREADGQSAGFGLGRALTELLGFTYTTEPYTRLEGGTLKVSGRRSLRTVTDERGASHVATKWSTDPAAAGSAHWLVLTTDPTGAPRSESPFASPTPTDFDSIRLHAGETAYLIIVRDQDGDGLSDTSEAVLGTRRDVPDTDGDGLTDGDEVNVGWTVTFFAGPTGLTIDPRHSYAVRSDPRSADGDGDGMSDALERTPPFGSSPRDPLLPDTDGDGRGDQTDARNDVPATLADLAADPSLLSYWNADAIDSVAGGAHGVLRAAGGAAAVSLVASHDDGTPQRIHGVDRLAIDGRAIELAFDDFPGTLNPRSPVFSANHPDITSVNNRMTYAFWFRPARTSYVHQWHLMGCEPSFIAAPGGSDLVDTGPRINVFGGPGTTSSDVRMFFRVPLNGGSAPLEISRRLSPGQWHLAVATISFESEHTVVRLFGEDGVLLDSATGPRGVRALNPSSSGFSVGALPVGAAPSLTGSGAFAIGSIDDVRIYNRALRTSEAIANFRSGS